MRYNYVGYSVISIGFWAQEAVCNQVIDVGTGFMKVLYLGRAPRTKETLPNFREKCRVTQYSRVFRGLTGSQRTPRFWGVIDSIFLNTLAPSPYSNHLSTIHVDT